MTTGSIDLDQLVQQILKTAPDIKKIYDSNQARREHIRRAIKILGEMSYQDKKVIDKKIIADSLRAIIDSIVYDELRIFISYKSSYQRQVNEIGAILSGHSTKVKCYGGKQITPGEDWRDWIDKHTTLANWFLLIYGDPDLDWGWCLYECGLFDKKKRPGERDFCLYLEDQQPPNQLKHLQGIPMNDEGIKMFLSKVYIEPDAIPGLDPINPKVPLDEIAKDISKHLKDMIIKPAVKPIYYDHYVEINLRDQDESLMRPIDKKPFPTAQDKEEVIRRAEIIATDDPTLRLFRCTQKPNTFGELIAVALDNTESTGWLHDLFDAIRYAANAYQSLPVNTSTFAIGGKRYRPFLHRVDFFEKNGGVERYHVAILEDIVAPSPITTIDEIYATAIELLKISFRMRFEVLEPAERAVDPERTMQQVIEALERVEESARIAGLNEERVGRLLSRLEKKERDSVTSWLKSWRSVRAQHDEEPRVLDKAINDKNYPLVREILLQFWSQNKEFLRIVAKFFLRMTQQLEN